MAAIRAESSRPRQGIKEVGREDRLSKEINTIKPSTRPRWLQLRLEPHGPLLN